MTNNVEKLRLQGKHTAECISLGPLFTLEGVALFGRLDCTPLVSTYYTLTQSEAETKLARTTSIKPLKPSTE